MKRIFSYAKYLKNNEPSEFMQSLDKREVKDDDSYNYVETVLEDGFVGRVYLLDCWFESVPETVRESLHQLSKTDPRASVILRRAERYNLSDQDLLTASVLALLSEVKH